MNNRTNKRTSKPIYENVQKYKEVNKQPNIQT